MSERHSTLEQQASNSGISPFGEIRDAIIEVRGNLLTEGQFEHAVLFTHVIWWLSSMGEELGLWESEVR